MRVLDLFCGAGGLALGFNKAGFNVTGVDISPVAGQTFTFNRIGSFVQADLSHEEITGSYDIVIGGPPCRPWSPLNLKKRRSAHDDYQLIKRFFLHVKHIMPEIFVMENVPALARDPIFISSLGVSHDYSIAYEIINYADYGAATRRRRLIVVGVKKDSAAIIFQKLVTYRKPPATVKDAISWLKDKPRGSVADHDWPNLRTIQHYTEKYKKGRYGWYVLKWDEPAPSFGNIMKTYILHPDGNRVISVREALSIMGFPEEFCFPPKLGLSVRYQMIADAVSPVFSFALAQTIKSIYY